MTSINSRQDRSLKFTAHAAEQFRRRYGPRLDGADIGQLLEEPDIKTGVEFKRLVHKTFPSCNIDLIHVVNAPQMYGMYLLRKEEMRLTDVGHNYKELILYHVTTKSRAVESLKSGLDWRLTQRSKFGCGVSFSDDADYANYYADHSSKEDSQVIIVCAVLVNKMYRVSGKRKKKNLIVPSDCADTTVSPNGRVYVKYNDFDFYPLYLMYYQRTPEHLNESKYFHNNPNNEWQQNNRVIQQQQRVQCKRKRVQWQGQHLREQVPHMQEQARHMQDLARCMQEQARHMREHARHMREHAHQQAHHMREQVPHIQEQARHMREQAQHMREQAQNMREQAHRQAHHMREQARHMREHARLMREQVHRM